MKRLLHCRLPLLLLGMLAAGALSPQPRLSDSALLEEVQRRAVRFFLEKADPVTGLANDRARNDGQDDFTVASTASTGYRLAALALGAQRRWIPREEAKRQAIVTLRFTGEKMEAQHGWLTHFVDRRTGERVWKSEVSTIDTALLVLGALASGQYFGGEVRARADRLYARLDWRWMLTNGGRQPGKRVISHGWTPEKGFIPYNYDQFCEASLLYLLGLGSERNPLPAESWEAWKRAVYRYRNRETLGGGPIFLNQMVHGYYDLRDRRDRPGWDYWVSGVNASWIQRKFCADRAGRAYGPNLWGINASDGPKGYRAHGIPQPEDGTLSPTGALASIIFEPRLSLTAARAMMDRLGRRLWGRYGFANAINLGEDWVDPDVIGIDLGMALLAIENHRSGFFWRLIASHPSTSRAYRAAGLRRTRETEPRPLRRIQSSPRLARKRMAAGRAYRGGCPPVWRDSSFRI